MTLIVPEIYEALVRERYKGKSVMRQLSEDLGMLQNTTVGGTVVFPQWSKLSAAEDMTAFTSEADRLEAQKLAMTSTNAPVKQYGKAIYVRDLEDMTALGEQVNEAAFQTGHVIARAVDKDLFDSALENINAVIKTTGGKITDAQLMEALNEFGDEQDVESIAGIVANSALIPSFVESPLFIDATMTTAAGFIGNGIVTNGLLGFYRGIPIYLSNKETERTPGTYQTLIIKKGALGYMEKRAIDVEEDRQAMSGGSNIVSNLVFANHIVRNTDVVTIETTTV